MTGRPLHPSDEDRIVAEMTRELDALDHGPAVGPPAGFTDRVMAAVEAEPLPQPARAFTLALLAGRIRTAASAVGDSWRVATSGFAPAAIRAQALALVLVVAGLSLALVGGAAVGAINVLTPAPSTAPVLPAPSVSPSLVPSPAPSDASPSPTASDSAEPSGTPEPTETAEPTGTDDHGGGSGSGAGSRSGSDSTSGGSGSGSGGATPQPTGTPEPADD
ncbi:MAG TPA: hypothetical protein VIK65_04360, partial [Candidatus Limnocylindrales bacterium]